MTGDSSFKVGIEFESVLRAISKQIYETPIAFIRGLLDSLPPPDTVWPHAEREKWLRTAESKRGLFTS